MEKFTLLFRIENVNDYDAKSRSYSPENYFCYRLKKSQIDGLIASLIRDEINGAETRELWSYSKSLAACLLKYNKYSNNEIHLFDEGLKLNSIFYSGLDENLERRDYSIAERVFYEDCPYFNYDEENEEDEIILLKDFVIDVSDNNLLDKYLRIFTGTGKKLMASPQKDSEVAVLNPSNDLVIEEYSSAVYTLYALQYKHKFLRYYEARQELIHEVENLPGFRFDGCENERNGFVYIINYLADCWHYEYSISKGIYDYFRNSGDFSGVYDSLQEFHTIINENFNEAYYNSDYNNNVLSDLCWRICYKTI